MQCCSPRGSCLASRQLEADWCLGSVLPRQSACCLGSPRPRKNCLGLASTFSCLGSSHYQIQFFPLTMETFIQKYLDFVADVRCTWETVMSFEHYENIQPLLEYVFCIPATSAPVKRVFSHGGLFMRPHRARLGDKLLCQLMVAKCNKHL